MVKASDEQFGRKERRRNSGENKEDETKKTKFGRKQSRRNKADKTKKQLNLKIGRMEEEMFEKLVDIIVNYVEVDKDSIKPESRFMEDLGFTSFDFMSMLGEVEEELDVEINQEEAANIRTVQEAADYLEKLTK